MATKKQKRAAGELRQAANREESRRIGLQAQKRDRERRQKKADKAKLEKAEETLRLQREKVAKSMRDMRPQETAESVLRRKLMRQP